MSAEQQDDTKTRFKVLIVDDDKDLRNVVARVLPKFGFETVYASDGEAALDILKRNPDIALVMLDWMLPRLSGMGVLQELQKWADHPPVVMVSARAERSYILKAVQAGAVDYIRKPVQLGQMILKINSIVNKRREEMEQRAKMAPDLEIAAETIFTIMDISETGVSFRSSFEVAPQSIVILQSQELNERLGLEPEQAFPVRVANNQPLKKGWKVGAEFIALEQEIKKKLSSACVSATTFKA